MKKTMTIPLEEYKELIRKAERVRILEEYIHVEKHVFISDVKRIMAIKEKENESV